MRIHLQSLDNPHNFPLSPEVYAAAAARSPDISEGQTPSFGGDRAGFEAACPDMEVLVAQTAALVDLIPFHAPKLKMIFVTSAGLEKLAPFTWLPPGVPILNNRGTHAVKAGEYGIMAILMLASRIPALATSQREQRWAARHGSVLAGRHIVFVGLGALGGTVAHHAKAFGMKVTGVRATAAPHPACDTVVGMDQLDSVLPTAEFLFMAAPLTPATTNLLSRERLALLPKDAGVVNIGRGGSVDQDAIMDSLDEGHLSGAVLDVFTPEPIPAGHRLWTTKNLLITPHVSADDPNTYNDRTLDIFFDNLRALRDGHPLPNEFKLDRGY